jgi:hypothetical protein
MTTYTRTDLADAKRFGRCTHGPTPMYFKAWESGPHGDTVVLYREPHHTALDIERAVKAVHAERSVIVLHVATPEKRPLRRPLTPFTTETAHGHQG